MESKPNYQSGAGKETNLKRFNLNQQTQVKQLINELNEKTRLRKQRFVFLNSYLYYNLKHILEIINLIFNRFSKDNQFFAFASNIQIQLPSAYYLILLLIIIT